ETDVQPLRKANAEVGRDVGVKPLATTSDGEKLKTPRPLLRGEQRWKRLQRSLSRKADGGKNRNKANLKVAKRHAQISETRRDTLQKFTTKLIGENQAILVEGLHVAGMAKNHTLAKEIAAAAFGERFRELESKARWDGRTDLELDRFFPSSKRCSACGHLSEQFPPPLRDLPSPPRPPPPARA